MKRNIIFNALLLLLLGASGTDASTDSLFAVARRLAHSGEYERSLVAIDGILQTDSSNTDALLLKGMVFLWQKKFDEAQHHLNRVVVQAPDYADAWIGLIQAHLRSGAPEAACSTWHSARKKIGDDSLLMSLRNKVCQPQEPKGSAAASERSREKYTLYGGAGTSLFGKGYNRSPWVHCNGGVDVEKKRWGLRVGINADRRRYDSLTLYGGELQVAPRFALLPKLVATLHFTVSPYRFVDTVYASQSVKLSLSAGLPAGIEVDGAARFGWYGEQLSSYYYLGVGKYIAHYLVAARVFVAPLNSKAYLSGTGTVRRFGKKSSRQYLQAGLALGRSPYDGGTLTRDGYLSFVEGQLKCALPIKTALVVEPSAAVAGEQLVQKRDFNGDGSADLRISAVRLRTTVLLTLHIVKK